MASGGRMSALSSSSPKSSSGSEKDIEGMKFKPYPMNSSHDFPFYRAKRVSERDLIEAEARMLLVTFTHVSPFYSFSSNLLILTFRMGYG